MDLSTDLPLQWSEDDDCAWAPFGETTDAVQVSPVPNCHGFYSVDISAPYVKDVATGKRLAEAVTQTVSDFFSPPEPDPEPDPWERHRQMERAVRVHVPVARQTHAFAMLAKESVFRAQDMLYDLPDGKLSRKLEKRLATIRAELEALEALDRVFQNGGGA